MTKAKKAALAKKLESKGVKQPTVVIEEALRADILVCTGLAMLEKETGIPQHNIFGCDHGSASGPPYCHQKVTKDRVAALRRSGQANGVGWTQLTWPPLVAEADKAGGAHIPRYQMRIGFKQLRTLFDQHKSLELMYARYNGSGSAATAYGKAAVKLRTKWKGVTGE